MVDSKVSILMTKRCPLNRNPTKIEGFHPEVFGGAATHIIWEVFFVSIYSIRILSYEAMSISSKLSKLHPVIIEFGR